MRTIQLTRGFKAIIDNCDYALVSKYNWHARNCGAKKSNIYAANNSGHGGNSKDIYMHRLISGAKKHQTVDHRDGNGLNNRRSNLRLLSNRTINGLNSVIAVNNTSGFKGVSWFPPMKKWRARVNIKSKEIMLGWFLSPVEASRAYNSYVSKIFAKHDK